jgi:hypothetical protein
VRFRFLLLLFAGSLLGVAGGEGKGEDRPARPGLVGGETPRTPVPVNRRGEPLVFAPEETVVWASPAQLRVYILTDDFKKISVINDKKGGLTGGDAPANEGLVPVELAKLHPRASLAVKPWPVWMAGITASFPYKAQLEEFQQKLQKAGINDVLAEEALEADDQKPTPKAFRFLGVNLERR